MIVTIIYIYIYKCIYIYIQLYTHTYIIAFSPLAINPYRAVSLRSHRSWGTRRLKTASGSSTGAEKTWLVGGWWNRCQATVFKSYTTMVVHIQQWLFMVQLVNGDYWLQEWTIITQLMKLAIQRLVGQQWLDVQQWFLIMEVLIGYNFRGHQGSASQQ